MTIQTIYRATCDAPHCPTSSIIEQITGHPDGWRRIDSTDHLADWKPGRQYRLTTGRRHADQRTRWDVTAGSFTLHLCPDHTAVFDGHQPTTEGSTADRRTGDRYVTVGCSCRALSWRVRNIIVVGREPMPNHLPERAWWEHLPEGLREYATRGRLVVPA